MKQRMTLTFFKHNKLRISILILSIIMTQSLLFASVLLYQQTSDGGLFDKHDITLEASVIGIGDKLSYWTTWPNRDKDAWDWRSKKAYVGRVLFQGEPGTVVTVTNLGPLPTHTNKNEDTPPSNKFYWTQVASGGKTSTDWTEYFLVLRPKGYTHATNKTTTRSTPV